MRMPPLLLLEGDDEFWGLPQWLSSKEPPVVQEARVRALSQAITWTDLHLSRKGQDPPRPSPALLAPLS